MEAKARETAAEKQRREEAVAAKRKAEWEAVQAEYSAADNLTDIPALENGGESDSQLQLEADGDTASRPASRQSSTGSRPTSRQSTVGSSRPHSRQSVASSSKENNAGQLTLRLDAPSSCGGPGQVLRNWGGPSRGGGGAADITATVLKRPLLKPTHRVSSGYDAGYTQERNNSSVRSFFKPWS